MSSLFDRWRTQGAPSALRWWIPSPAHLSRQLHTGPETSALATAFATLCALATGPMLAGAFAAVAHGATASRRSEQEGSLFGALGVGFMVLMLGVPVMAGAFALPRTRPHVARVAVALSAVAALVSTFLYECPAALAVVGVAALAGLALLARPTPRALVVLRRAALGSFLAAASGGFLLAACVAVGEVVPTFAAGWHAREVGVIAALVVGAFPLALGALMFVVHRADLAPWAKPETWQQAELGEGNVLRFANGGAPRQAPDAFGGHLGPVVVISLQQQERGAFRADGAPDDGWTVPGTLATVREALARSEAAALAAVITVFACALAPFAAGLYGAAAAFLS
jgi:hypothetical protein